MTKLLNDYKFRAILTIIFLFAANVKAQIASFDVTNYNAEIEPDIAAKSVKGKVIVQFDSLKNSLTEIQFDAGNLEIDAVSENKNSLVFAKQKSLLNVILTRPANLNERREITIEYHGTPKYGISFFPDQKQIYTIFSTSQWMPCVDAPDDRAAFRLNLILPRDFKVVGNGNFIKQSNLSGDKISSVWEQKNPVPTYIFGFAAGNFKEFAERSKRVEFRYLVSPQFSIEELLKIFRSTSDMLNFYESKAGVKYADKTYTQILAAGGVEQEMSSFTALGDDYGQGVLKDETDIWLGAHEFAHQWWGNMVTNQNWNHFWLNEGIASFMADAYLEHRFGRERYLAEIEKSKMRYEKARDAGNDKSLVFPDWNKPTREDRTIVYQKGAYVMHLLREKLGDEIFWKCLKEYTQTFWGKSVTTIEFQKSFEKSSGQDLSAFFDKWIYLKK
ncbi:MAG: M1 family metallopeptidase [Pyrinomonadaceae bacterium]